MAEDTGNTFGLRPRINASLSSLGYVWRLRASVVWGGSPLPILLFPFGDRFAAPPPCLLSTWAWRSRGDRMHLFASGGSK
eukprot:8482293-Pyramimonas_sp.AAC.1